MYILIRALITFVVVLLVLYLVNMLPIDGRAKQIVRVIVYHHWRVVVAQLSGEFLNWVSQPCAASKAM
jgi:hypothetical protein